jgi:hypothetical protein
MERCFYNTTELAELFGYANAKTLLNQCHKGKFEVPTYKIGKNRVADKEVVNLFFAKHRSDGFEKLQCLK